MRPGSSPLPATTSIVVLKSFTQRMRPNHATRFLNLIAARCELVFNEMGVLLTSNKDSLCETVRARRIAVICGSFPVLEAKKSKQSRPTGKPRQRLCHVHSGNQKLPAINALRAAKRCLIQAEEITGLTAVHIFIAVGATLHKNGVRG
jgi:hypothetical protein